MYEWDVEKKSEKKNRNTAKCTEGNWNGIEQDDNNEQNEEKNQHSVYYTRSQGRIDFSFSQTACIQFTYFKV